MRHPSGNPLTRPVRSLVTGQYQTLQVTHNPAKLMITMSHHLLRNLLIAFLPLLVWEQSTFGGLKWDSTTASSEVQYRGDPVELQFSFENDGKTPVTITKVDSSCNCTVPTLEKQKYEPGERGMIRAVYTPNYGVFGADRKMLRVETDDPEQPLTILRVDIHVRAPVEVQPGAVYWANGSEPVEKWVLVRVKGPTSAEGLEATPDQPGFDVSVQTITKGREYRVLVRPQSTKEVRFASIVLRPIAIEDLPFPPKFAAGVMAPGVEIPAEPTTQP